MESEINGVWLENGSGNLGIPSARFAARWSGAPLNFEQLLETPEGSTTCGEYFLSAEFLTPVACTDA
jgi:hypothetical protein